MQSRMTARSGRLSLGRYARQYPRWTFSLVARGEARRALSDAAIGEAANVSSALRICFNAGGRDSAAVPAIGRRSSPVGLRGRRGRDRRRLTRRRRWCSATPIDEALVRLGSGRARWVELWIRVANGDQLNWILFRSARPSLPLSPAGQVPKSCQVAVAYRDFCAEIGILL